MLPEEECELQSQSSEVASTYTKFKNKILNLCSWKVFKPILYGQGLSLLICGTAITSTYLTQDFNADIPFFQSFANYFLLALIYGTILMFSKTPQGENALFKILKENWWKFMIIAFVDVAANGFIVTAYQYTSLTSVQVLDCFILFVVMILSWIFLKVKFLCVHYIGVGLSLIGVAAMVVADWLLRGGESGSNPLLGDFFVIAGSICYGISNVAMEYFVKEQNKGFFEIPAMYGIFGSIASGILVIALERKAIVEVNWSYMSGLLFVGFVACMFLLYTLMPRVMMISSATTVNMSILTADLYALFAGIFLFSYKFSPLYIISFVVILVSLITYNTKLPQSRVTSPENDGDLSQGVPATPLASMSDCESNIDELSNRREGTSFHTSEKSCIITS